MKIDFDRLVNRRTSSALKLGNAIIGAAQALERVEPLEAIVWNEPHTYLGEQHFTALVNYALGFILGISTAIDCDPLELIEAARAWDRAQ